MKKYTATDSYLAELPDEQREMLEEVRGIVRSAAFEAEERFSYGMPGFYYMGSLLVFYACFKNHCSFFGASVTTFDKFKNELKDFKTTKGTIHFTADNRIPPE